MVQPEYFGERAGNWEREAEGAEPVEESDQGAAERDLSEESGNEQEAGAVGQVCARCGNVIAAGDFARLEADGRWMHEQCPGRPARQSD
jgi:adenine-specific DNA methylase